MAEAFEAMQRRIEEEPYAKMLGIRLAEINPGSAAVEMRIDDRMLNIFKVAHGGAIFSLIDGAFEAAANSHGTVAVALNVNISYIRPAQPGETLRAQAEEISRSKRISTYEISVKNQHGDLVATCHAMAYRKKDPLPFL